MRWRFTLPTTAIRVSLVINGKLPEDIGVRVFANDDLRISGVGRNNVVQVRTLRMEAT
jgi:hypothetical protein